MRDASRIFFIAIPCNPKLKSIQFASVRESSEALEFLSDFYNLRITFWKNLLFTIVYSCLQFIFSFIFFLVDQSLVIWRQNFLTKEKKLIKYCFQRNFFFHCFFQIDWWSRFEKSGLFEVAKTACSSNDCKNGKKIFDLIFYSHLRFHKKKLTIFIDFVFFFLRLRNRKIVFIWILAL